MHTVHCSWAQCCWQTCSWSPARNTGEHGRATAVCSPKGPSRIRSIQETTHRIPTKRVPPAGPGTGKHSSPSSRSTPICEPLSAMYCESVTTRTRTPRRCRTQTARPSSGLEKAKRQSSRERRAASRRRRRRLREQSERGSGHGHGAGRPSRLSASASSSSVQQGRDGKKSTSRTARRRRRAASSQASPSPIPSPSARPARIAAAPRRAEPGSTRPAPGSGRPEGDRERSGRVPSDGNSSSRSCGNSMHSTHSPAGPRAPPERVHAPLRSLGSGPLGFADSGGCRLPSCSRAGAHWGAAGSTARTSLPAAMEAA